MDVTPVYFDLVPNKVVDRIGVKSCIVKTTGAEKRHITHIDSDSKWRNATPFITFKEKWQPQVEVCTLHAQTCMHAIRAVYPGIL